MIPTNVTGRGATHLGYWAARQPEAEAAVFVDPDATRPVERIAYGALDAAANRLARALRRSGLRRDDRVAFVLGNEPAVFTVFWAAMRTGLHVVPINRHLTAGSTWPVSSARGNCAFGVICPAPRPARS